MSWDESLAAEVLSRKHMRDFKQNREWCAINVIENAIVYFQPNIPEDYSGKKAPECMFVSVYGWDPGGPNQINLVWKRIKVLIMHEENPNVLNKITV